MRRLAVATGLLVTGVVASLAQSTTADDLAAEMGLSLFERRWTGEGLGPLYNERSCAACHQNGGPARFVALPDGGLAIAGAVVRLGDANGHGDPTFGIQIQTHGIGGLAPEAAVDARLVPLPGGLQRVDVSVKLSAGALGPGVTPALRVAPSARTAAAIDRVDMAALDRLSDPADADGDGVSGRVRWFKQPDGTPLAGRFGWRAGQVSLEDQVASAFALDMGLSSPQRLHPHGDCTALQAACLAVPAAGRVEYGGYEMSGDLVALVADFVRSLDVTITPENASAADARGAALFAAAGCAACHRPDVPAKGGGSVRLYSDLMLHDMGEGLSDRAGEADVAATEWRTPPLASIAADSGPTRRYLHDGRAATIEDAIRWHGGEADAARRRFEAMSPDEQARLVAFVKSL